MRYLRTLGAWPLDALDKITESGEGYCVLHHNYSLPQSAISSYGGWGLTTAAFLLSEEMNGLYKATRSKSVGSTEHSSKYDRTTSEVFLQKRH
jgi:hypothetical protein